MFIFSFDNRTRAKHWTFFLAALAVIAVTAPAAHAVTYKFVVPTTTIQGALDTSISGATLNLYGFFEVYIRPALPADGDGGQNVSSYTPAYDISPIVSGNDYWAASTGISPLDVSNNSFYFFSSGVIRALITTNANVGNGQVVDGKTMEKMPGTDTFTMFLSTASGGFLPGTIRFIATGTAYKFTDSNATAFVNKTTIWSGTFDAVGSETPEPASMFSIAGGSLILALLNRRRRRADASPGS
jgi:hypothetical protein